MDKPNYYSLYEELLQTPEGSALRMKALNVVHDLKLQTMEAMGPINIRVKFGTDETRAMVSRVVSAVDVFKSPKFSFIEYSDRVNFVRSEDVEPIVEAYLGKTISQRGCRKSIVMRGSMRSYSFADWINEHIRQRVRQRIIAKLNRKHQLSEDELQIFESWRRSMLQIEKSKLKQTLLRFAKKNLPAEFFKECVDEFIVESVQST